MSGSYMTIRRDPSSTSTKSRAGASEAKATLCFPLTLWPLTYDCAVEHKMHAVKASGAAQASAELHVSGERQPENTELSTGPQKRLPKEYEGGGGKGAALYVGNTGGKCQMEEQRRQRRCW